MSNTNIIAKRSDGTSIENTPRKYRVLSGLGNIRNYFSQISYIDIHTEEIDIDKENDCFLIEANEYGELCRIVRFKKISEILSYLQIQFANEKLEAATAIYGNNKETIYELNTEDYALISRKFCTEETVFIKSSTQKVEEPIDIESEVTDEDEEIPLIPITKLHFRLMDDWFKYQDDYLKKYRRQQGQGLWFCWKIKTRYAMRQRVLYCLKIFAKWYKYIIVYLLNIE